MEKKIIYVKNSKVEVVAETTASILRKAGVKVLAVHGGSFHADDLVASALATCQFKELLIYREFSIENPENYDYIVDIGMKFDGVKFFDHHQEIPVYEDGVKPCGASLFAEAIMPRVNYEALYERVLRPVATQDNGQTELVDQYPNLLFGWVSTMNPIWNNQKQSFDEQFAIALKMAIPVLKQIIETIKAEAQAQEIVESARQEVDGKILVLPEYAPWHNLVVEQNKEVLFVVHPSNRGGFMVQCVPPSLEDGFSQRLSLPKEWLDNRPEGCTFVHRGRFCCSFETEEQAIKALSNLLG